MTQQTGSIRARPLHWDRWRRGIRTGVANENAALHSISAERESLHSFAFFGPFPRSGHGAQWVKGSRVPRLFA